MASGTGVSPPLGICVLAGLFAVALIAVLITGAAVFASLSPSAPATDLDTSPALIAGAVFLLAPLLGYASWGLLRAVPSAWTVSFALIGFNFVADLAMAASGRPADGLLGAVATSLLLRYLLRPHVRDYFGFARAPKAAAATAS